MDNNIEWINSSLSLQNRFSTINIATGLISHNPITAYLARQHLLDSSYNFYVSFNYSEFQTKCTAGTYILVGNGCYLNNFGFISTVIFTNLNQGNEALAHQDFIYTLIDLFVAVKGPNSIDPITGAQNSTLAINSYKSCYNKLYQQVHNGILPYPTTSSDDPMNCPVNFVNRAFQFCYNNTNQSYGFQQDVPQNLRCSGNENNATICSTFCTPDGYCVNSNKCGFIYCVLDSLYCDWQACVGAQPTPASPRVCCTLDPVNYIAHICPPDNSPANASKLICTMKGTAVDCCDNFGNCAASATINVGGCFIATAAFGSSMDPSVWALRVFRDTHLLTNPFGRLFVQFYYTFSPVVAEIIAQSEFLKAVTRTLLTPLVAAVKTFF